MFNKIKNNEKLVELIMAIAFGVLASFYIIYKISNSMFMVITGLLILSIGYFSKDPDTIEENKTCVEPLVISSEEALKPNIIKEAKKKTSKKVKA